MTRTRWVYPAISCIPLSLIFTSDASAIWMFLYLLWFIRIFCLRHKETFQMAILIGVLFSSVIFFKHMNQESILSGNETKFLVYPKETTMKIDGNSLRFSGEVLIDDEYEEVVISQILDTEAEKDEWLEKEEINYLLIEGQLREPIGNTNFHQFNYRNYLKRKNIYWQLQADVIEEVTYKASEKKVSHRQEELRFRIFRYIDQTFTQKIGSYIKILFFADNRGVSEEVLQNYRSIGIIHLFSISGFHITYLAHLIRRFFLRIGITHERTNLLVLLILPTYGLLAGLGVSVFRAVSQTSIPLIGKLFNKEIDTLSAWSLTMLLALFLNPYQVYAISFQLSYLLSGMFILMGNINWLEKLNPLQGAILFSFMSGLASLPILAYHFFEVSWITVFANLLFMPFFTYFLFPSLLFIFLSSVLLSKTFIFSFLNALLTNCILFMEGILTLLNDAFDFTFVIGRLPIVITLLFIWSIFKIITKVEENKRPTILSVVLLIGSLFYHQFSPAGYVLMLDVGQGDSLVIKEPWTQKVTMIDTGGRAEWYEKEEWQISDDPFTIGKDVTVPALKALGIQTIDRMYITHADADHSGEIKNISKNIRVKELAATKGTLKDPGILEQLSSEEQTELLEISPVETLTYPTKDTVALHPINELESNNNHSLTLYVKIGNDRWLFTGDLEVEGERSLVKKYPNLKVNYLKVAHHGSNTSTSEEFLEHIETEHALISVGRNNHFGHPNNDVLERLEDLDLNIQTTSENGAIMVKYFKIPFIDYWFTKTYTAYEI